MINYFSLISIFSALCILAVSAYAFGRRPKGSDVRFFQVYLIASFTLTLLDFLIWLPVPLFLNRVLLKVGMVLFLLIPITYLAFIHSVVSRPFDFIFKTLAAFSLLVALASLFIQHHTSIITTNSESYQIVPTLSYIPFFLAALAISLRTVFFLFQGLRENPGYQRKKQLQLLVMGFLFSTITVTVLLIIVPIFFHHYIPYRFTSLSIVVHILFIYHAISRYNLMSVDTEQIQTVMRLLFGTIHEGVIITDGNGAIRDMNQTARSLFPHPENIHRIDDIAQHYSPLKSADDVPPVTCDQLLDDSPHSVIISKSSIHDHHPEMGDLILLRDITEQVELEEKIEQKNRLESLGALAGGIAHDFNNQLAGIMGCADMLKMDLRDSPEQYDLVDIIMKAAKRSSDLTNQLLAFARKGKYQVGTVNIHNILTEVITILDHSIDKRIGIEKRFHAPIPLTTGDASQLHNVFLNIAVNARDAMPGGGRITFETGEVQCDAAYIEKKGWYLSPGVYTRIRIIDTGEGMTPEVLSRACEPFFTTKEKDRGTGMGLAAVYGTVHNHHGTIEIESECEKGTTVSVFLPVSNDTSPAHTTDTVRRTSPANIHVLLVEDESMVAAATGRILERAGHTVTLCTNGNDAVARYRELWKTIDVVILDLVLPGLRGAEVFHHLRSCNPNVKILLSSGYTIDEEAEQLLGNGASAFIQKPYEARVLLGKIAEIAGIEQKNFVS